MDIPLKSLKFLSIDCQATGSSPKISHLLEIGWLVFDVDALQKQETLSPQTTLILPPKGFALPRYITKLTGIRSTHLEKAVSEASAIDALRDQAESLTQENQLPLCLAIVHYARYEISFLEQAFKQCNQEFGLLFEVICTHQVASRIFPHLPRKGLRAIAGYLGYRVPVLKRCRAHLTATAFIWCKMVEILGETEDVHTLGQLRHWLKVSKVPTISKSYPMPPEARSGLPDLPGVYRMKRRNGDVLYIGKATSLKQRINSYFINSCRHTENKLEMLTQATDLNYTVIPTALEAALQETDEIKRFKPPYNIALTTENRHLFFVSRNFGNRSTTRNEICRLGPVPSESVFAAAMDISRYIDGQLNHMDLHRILDMPANNCPDVDCFQSGMLLFIEKYGDIIAHRPYGQTVLLVGRISWIARAKEKAARLKCEPDEIQEPERPTDFVWTPDAVVRILESICRRCGFFLRRAKWLAMLSEATVAWKNRHADADQLNIIQLKSGKISNRWHAHLSQNIPLPPNHNETISNRQMNIDLMTYDRLRVLTTEMRRLITDDRLVCIRLGTERYLFPDQLRIMFSWI